MSFNEQTSSPNKSKSQELSSLLCSSLLSSDSVCFCFLAFLYCFCFYFLNNVSEERDSEIVDGRKRTEVFLRFGIELPKETKKETGEAGDVLVIPSLIQSGLTDSPGADFLGRGFGLCHESVNLSR